MTRADMFANPVREDWMTDELIAKIKGVAREGKITCAAAQQFARDNGIVMNKMKSFVDVVGLKGRAASSAVFNHCCTAFQTGE